LQNRCNVIDILDVVGGMDDFAACRCERIVLIALSLRKHFSNEMHDLHV